MSQKSLARIIAQIAIAPANKKKIRAAHCLLGGGMVGDKMSN